MKVRSTVSGLATINLHAAGITLVQEWIDDPSTNFGMIIQDYADTTNAGIGFDSSEAATAAYRPKLTMTYGFGSSLLAARVAAPKGAGSIVRSAADVGELKQTWPEESMHSTPMTVRSANSGSLINQKSVLNEVAFGPDCRIADLPFSNALPDPPR